MNPNFKPRGRRQEDPHKINERISAKEIRLVGDNVEMGVYPTEKAIEIAFELGLDLVEISPNAEPPVCKVVDYKKFLYEQKKKQKEIKANAIKQEIKEIRFGPNTDEHDVNFKLKHAIAFLDEGNKVRAYVFYKGRTIIFIERGVELLMGFANKLIEGGHAKLEMEPKREGKKMVILLAPKGKK
ncbi:MAG: translation initiation factor IF-3 [Bacteroidia bacterium]|jgi:translation initiation factor IF-3|nr:translation initiation factor IF-3 [Bacteroidia bacterium]